MVDAGDSKSPAARRAGSSPALGTKTYQRRWIKSWLQAQLIPSHNRGSLKLTHLKDRIKGRIQRLKAICFTYYKVCMDEPIWVLPVHFNAVIAQIR